MGGRRVGSITPLPPAKGQEGTAAGMNLAGHCCPRLLLSVLLQTLGSCLPPPASIIRTPVSKIGFPAPPLCDSLRTGLTCRGDVMDGQAPPGPSHTKRFGLRQGHFQSEVYGAFESECPALASGRERIAQSHAGEGIWTTAKARLPAPAALVSGVLGPLGGSGQLQAFLLTLWPTCCSRARAATSGMSRKRNSKINDEIKTNGGAHTANRLLLLRWSVGLYGTDSLEGRPRGSLQLETPKQFVFIL